MMELVLASQSPRRAQILNDMQLPFTTIVPAVDEAQRTDESAIPYVTRLAKAKARRGFELFQQRAPVSCVVLAADTIVVVSHKNPSRADRDEILGKPRGLTESVAMLKQLSGRSHQVHTGVVATDGPRERATVVSSVVHFRALPEQEIAAYCAHGEGADKAGSYGIQGIGGIFVERIEGSFSGVMGLPVHETETLLQSLDVDTWSMRDQWLKNSS